jgi:hypothetical protein
MKNRVITVQGAEVTISTRNAQDYISLTDMLKAKDGDFFIADWLRNRNTIEFLGIWESIYNPGFNYGEFAIIKSAMPTQTAKATYAMRPLWSNLSCYRIWKVSTPC